MSISRRYRTYRSQASQDFASCENSKKIMAAGNKSKYPAVWAAYKYTTTGTKVGDWCLPAAGILTSYYNNQNAINTGFIRASGTQFTNSTCAWSSSVYSNSGAWNSYFTKSYGLLGTVKSYYYEVRPVLEFQPNSIQSSKSGALALLFFKKLGDM